jgi:hypothetical protein
MLSERVFMNHDQLASTRRAAPRAECIGKKSDIRVRCADWGSDARPVINISVSGAKFGFKYADDYFKKGDEYEVCLELRDHFVYIVKVRIAHATDEAVGIEFLPQTRRLKHLIASYFKSELAQATG